MPRPSKLKTKDPLKVVVLVLENNQGEVLLTQRQKHQHLAGYWEFPGGKIEKNETPVKALRRECMEELNYSVETPKHILSQNHSYAELDVSLLIYHEISSNPKVTPCEGQPLQWVKKSNLKLFKLPEANQAIINYLCN